MADRYWLGITGTWITSSTTVWSTSAPLSLVAASCSGTTLTTTDSPALVVGMTVWSSTFVSLGTITGGSGNTWTVSIGGTYASQTMIAATVGASVPTASDNVFFTRPSGDYTVNLSGALACNNFSKVGTSIRFSNTGTLTISGSFSLTGTTTWTANGTITFNSTVLGNTIVTSGATLAAPIIFDGIGGSWALADALTTTALLGVVVTNGSFDTAGFAFSTPQLSSSNTNIRAINLANSTVTLSIGSGPAIGFAGGTAPTFNAGISQINISGNSATLNGNGCTFYNVSFTSGVQATSAISGENIFNNLTIAGRTSGGVNNFSIADNQIINGTLTLSAGTNTSMRTFLRSDTLGANRTLTVNNFATGSANIDFRDITVAGAAAPISGTRFGDCKGNTGITFPTPKEVYWITPGALSAGLRDGHLPGGASSITNFPLAQDTAIFTSTVPASGSAIIISAPYNIGTLDMSARTTNTMSLATATSTPTIYGNWVNGTGTTLSGTGTMTFAGRGSQTITSAGKTFTQPITINSPGGSVTLQDAMSLSTGLTFTQGTFDAVSYNVTQVSSGLSGTLAKTVSLGSGTWTLTASSIAWGFGSSTNCTVTGTGTISLTSGISKVFAGGGIQTYPTINQGGTGNLIISGSNKFANITNTAQGQLLFTGGTTNEFMNFNFNGVSTTARLAITSNNTIPAILKKPSTWYMGSGSLDNGNNTGLIFEDGGGINYLAVSYINGQVSTPTVTYAGNFFAFF